MRQILFRGKRLDNEGWVEGWLIALGKESFTDPERYGVVRVAVPTRGSHVVFNLKIDEVDPETVGQYTGMTDRNGVKVFEGDVVLASLPGLGDNPDFHGNAVVHFAINNQQTMLMHDGMYVNDLDHMTKQWIEVISNRWDTPELPEVHNG